MANGKIIYTPLQTRALVLDGAHYTSLDQAAFNPGAGDFGCDFLGALEADAPDVYATIIRKGPDVLSDPWASAAGWALALDRDNRRLRLKLNDGNAAGAIDVYSNNAVFVLGQRFSGAVRADRDGQARFIVNGLDAGGGAISSRPGSLNNTGLLKIGAYDTTHDRFKGALDLVRVDHGRLLPDVWYAEEWDRLRFGCYRESLDFLACWLFGDTLVDASLDAYTLAWQGGGAPVYADGWPYSAAPLSYLFEENFRRNYTFGRLDLDDKQRAADGSDFTDAGPLKRRITLPFNYLPASQQTAFLAANQTRQSFAFFLDSDRPRTCWCKFAVPPDFNHQHLQRAAVDLELEES